MGNGKKNFPLVLSWLPLLQVQPTSKRVIIETVKCKNKDTQFFIHTFRSFISTTDGEMTIAWEKFNNHQRKLLNYLMRNEYMGVI
jgi:hypothetical protein